MKSVACAVVAVVAISFVAAAPNAEPSSQSGMSLRLELFVDDVEKSLEFYTGVLGFKKLAGSPTYQPIQSGSVTIGLGPADRLNDGHYFNPELQKARRGLGAEIVLEVDDVRAVYEHVKKSDHRILSPLVRRPWGLTDFRIVDPDGYYLRITSRE